jgi:hypothetical protein
MGDEREAKKGMCSLEEKYKSPDQWREILRGR